MHMIIKRFTWMSKPNVSLSCFSKIIVDLFKWGMQKRQTVNSANNIMDHVLNILKLYSRCNLLFLPLRVRVINQWVRGGGIFRLQKEKYRVEFLFKITGSCFKPLWRRSTVLIVYCYITQKIKIVKRLLSQLQGAATQLVVNQWTGSYHKTMLCKTKRSSNLSLTLCYVTLYILQLYCMFHT